MPTLLRDLRYGVRTLRQNPSFTIIAILSLALGIGANTAIFQLIDTVRLRSLPVAEPQRLAMVQFVDASKQRGSHATAFPALTNPQWERFRDSQDMFSGVLAWWDNSFGLSSGGDQRLARGLFVSGGFFGVLGVPALHGRVFTASDDRRGCGLPGAVVSYAFWQREFAADPSVIGRKLTLNYRPVEILGVTGPNFTGLEVGRSFDVAVPICSQASLWTDGNWLDTGTTWWLNVIGRLKPGWTASQVNARLQVLSPGLFRATLPGNYPPVNVKDYLDLRLTSVPADAGVSMLRERYSDPLLLLLITAGLVLLIACANLANLMLARATAREHEIAVRLALGATRGNLIRQLMAESLLLAAGGAAVGLYLSAALSRIMVALLSSRGDSLSLDLAPDGVVLAFTAGVATVTCLLFGVIPARRATSVSASQVMRSKGGRGVVGDRNRFGIRQILVVSQVSLSLVLLIGALLFSSSLRNLLSVDAGFRQNGVLMADLDFRRLPIQPEKRVAFEHDLLDKIRAIPGVEGAGEVGILPLSGSGIDNRVWIDGSDGSAKMTANFNSVGREYLKAMDMPLLAGRDFNDHDAANTPRVAIVNQSFARRLGLGGNLIGKRFRREATPTSPEFSVEVVGLMPDTKYYTLSEAFLPIAFFCIDQDEANTDATFLIRSAAPLSGLISATRAVISGTNHEITTDFRSFASTVADGLLRERLLATLTDFFGVLATLIAALGLYGVMSYLVALRTNEIGVRVALGAGRGDILGLILRQSALLLALGLAAGILLALALGRSVSSLLFGLKANDAVTMAVAAILLAAVTQAASYLPARRAARLEPMVALREE